MLIIIVPYRDRAAQKHIFIPHMKAFLSRKNIEYKICFVEQSDDNRPFNRGFLKNVGFVEMKKKWGHIQNLTYCHHDIDTIPMQDDCIYELYDRNTVYNPYGVDHALAKIYLYTGEAYETVNGNPNNFWGWGMEDVCLQGRFNAAGIRTDRTNFEYIGTNIKFNDILVTENTRAWPSRNIEENIALFRYEQANFHTSRENGLSNLKYTLLSAIDIEEPISHILVNIDMELCDNGLNLP